MKIKIENPEFGAFDKNGNFTMHLFEVVDENLVHSTGHGGEYQRRAVVSPEHVKAYAKENEHAKAAQISVLK